MGNLEEKAQLS